ncbi:hypothetical protein V1522DRAFT_346781, partial [Lipomyces starkeyi]
LTIGQYFATGVKARSYVQYDRRNNCAVKDGRAKNKDNTIYLYVIVAARHENSSSSMGTHGKMRDLREARSILSQCPWRMRFKETA